MHRERHQGLAIGTGVAFVAATLLGCPRATPGTTGPEPLVRHSDDPTLEPAPEDDLVDRGEGFEPPKSLTDPVPELVVSDEQLRPPHGVPAARRTTYDGPWPEGLEMVPASPVPPVPGDALPCRTERYLPHDERPLVTVEYAYDAEGHVTMEAIDEDTDGTIDLRIRYRWDPDGRLAKATRKHAAQPSCDGKTPGYTIVNDYLYDAHGVWLGQRNSEDGVPEGHDELRAFVYDAAGRPIRWFEYEDGVLGFGTTLRWDDRDRIIETVNYRGAEPFTIKRALHRPHERYEASWGDGAWEVARFVLGPDDRKEQVQHDADGDGTVDMWQRITYDGEGRAQQRDTDDDADGTIDAQTSVRWDDAGRRVEQVTTGKDAAVHTWTYDDEGRVLRWSLRRDDSWVEDFEAHAYDAAGREIERTVERHRAVTSASDLTNYVNREHWTRAYDEQGRLVREEVLEGELGPNERVEYIYDCAERYRRYPRRNPLDNPDTAAECFETFE